MEMGQNIIIWVPTPFKLTGSLAELKVGDFSLIVYNIF